MLRSDWLQQMRSKAEALYDFGAPLYWTDYGKEEASDNLMQREYLRRFLGHFTQPSLILSAACGAGRYDGIVYRAGHSLLGIDQSAGMLARAREHFPLEHYPRLRYQKVGLQEMALDLAQQGAFDGAFCIDSTEHICPEDYPFILHAFSALIKPGGWLYLTAETHESAVEDGEDLAEAYTKALAQGLPVVYGEVVDEFESAYALAMSDQSVRGETAHNAVYRYYPALEQVKTWIAQAGLRIVEEGHGSAVHHFILQHPLEIL